jgi:hypothetical protein
MKSIVMKSIYAGLGLLGSGKETVEQLGRKIARQADLSEKEGQRIARDLRARSEKAAHSLRRAMETEVGKAVKVARQELSNITGKKSSAGAKPKRRRAKRAKPAKAHEGGGDGSGSSAASHP